MQLADSERKLYAPWIFTERSNRVFVILREYKHIYINVAYSVPFRFPASSIVGLGLGLVVGLGTVLVFFLHFLLTNVC